MEIPRVTVEEVGARLARGERIAFVDARSAKAYATATEQLPGSIRIPPDADVAQHVARLPRGPVVAYCT